jgi:hypothetical protein
MPINQCQGVKKDGERCQTEAKAGENFCRWHKVDLSERPEVLNETRETIKRVPYQFHDGGVSENAAIRMLSMVIPNCPRESNPEISRKDGTSVPNPRYTGEESCQLAYRFNNHGRWNVDKCISLGHDPYYTMFRKTIVEEAVGEDGYVSQTRNRVVLEKRLNVIQVSDNPRHSSRTEVQLALAKGCRFIQDVVCTCSLYTYKHIHEAPCEFRNCVAPPTVETRYGNYCSERHARLVAADFQKIMLPVGGDPYSQDQAMEEREVMLANLNIRKVG